LWQIPSKGGRPIRLTDGQGPEGQPALSHDGLHLVYSTYVNNRDVVIRDLTSGHEDRVGGVRTEQSPVFSPDGKWLAFVSDRWAGRYDLWIQPIAAGRPVGLPQRLTDHPGSVAQPAFSPDGKWIAYYRVTQGQRDIWIVPSSGGAPRQFTNDPAPDIHPTWSPDGSQLAFVSARDGQDQIWIQPVADGRPAGDAMRLTSGSIQPATPRWSPDGGVLGFLGRLDNDIWIVAANGTIPPKRITHGADAMRLAWDRSSNHLWANAYWGEKNLSLRTVDVHTGEARPLPAPVVLGADPLAIDFDISPDGQEVAFVRQELRGNLWVHTLTK
jgi:Tol biopolymer transport system component